MSQFWEELAIKKTIIAEEIEESTRPGDQDGMRCESKRREHGVCAGAVPMIALVKAAL